MLNVELSLYNVLVVAAVLHAMPFAAQLPEAVVDAYGTGNGFAATGSSAYETGDSTTNASPRAVQYASGGGPPPELVGLAPMTGTLADGSACLGTVSNVFGSAEQAQNSTFQTLIGNDAVAGTPVCPPAAALPGVPVVQVSPEQVAVSFWRQADLPVPQPHVAPGWAITGKTAYLEANAEQTAQFEWAIPGFGVLVVDAQAELVVDWDDGRGPQSYDSAGGPWPDGDVTNVYGDVGVVDIVVTQQWTADWSLGTATGTLGGLQTSGAIEEFEVRQIQAVIG